MKFAARHALARRTATFVAGILVASTPLEILAQELEEIIVTARKRDESIQEVPVAVTAISSTMIADMNLRDLDDIAKVTAGLIFDPEFSRTSNRPVIRGQANILGDSGVSYFIDGVYITGSINDYNIRDVERIEVVKGPQSALYGRNTYSGAINIITKSPAEEFGADVLATLSDDSQTEVAASINGPVGDSFGFGLSARYYELDGPWTNSFDGTDIGFQESTALSGVVSFEPNDRFSARARVYYNETRDGQPVLWSTNASENNCFPDDGALYMGAGRYYCGTLAPRPVNSDWRIQAPDTRDDNDTLQASLRLDIGITDDLSLTSITGYNDVDSTFYIEADYGPTQFQNTNVTGPFPFTGFPVPPFGYGYVSFATDFTFAEQAQIEDISQEFRLSYETDNASFLVGAYYFDQETTERDVRELPPGAQAIADANFVGELLNMQAWCADNAFLCEFIVPFGDSAITVPRDVNGLDITNTAIFGMMSFAMGEKTNITIEGRWAKEEIDRLAISQDLGGPPGEPNTASAEFTSFNPRFTIDHRVSDDSMIYLLLASGNKPGGFNSTVAIEAGLPTFDEEEVTSLELGTKNSVADGQLIANVALFFNQINGYQLTQNARAGANTTSATVNAGDADIFGAELELFINPTAVEGLSMMFNYAYTDSEFTNGEDENWGVLLDVADDGLVNCSLGFQLEEFPGQVCTTSSTNPNGNPPKFGPIAGKRIPRTAEHQLFFDAEFRQPFTSGSWEWFIGANFSHESSKFAQVTNFAETGNTNIVNARFGFAGDNWNVTLWGKNLTDEDSTPLALRYADAADGFKRSFAGTVRREKHVGVTASISF